MSTVFQTSIPLSIDADGNIIISPVPATNVCPAAAHLEDSGSIDMNVDGSTTTVEFEAGPGAGEKWYVFALSFYIEDPGSADSTDFGSISGGLTNGLELKIKTNGTEKTSANLTENINIVQCFSGNAGTASEESVGFLDEDDVFYGLWQFNPVVTLDGDQSDFFKFRVRDNLSGLAQLRSNIHYWIVV